MKNRWIRWMGVWMTMWTTAVGCGDSDSKEPTVVLVHGAWMGAWSWDPVVDELQSRGRRVVAVDLPGHGDDDAPLGELGLDRYVASVVALLEAEDAPVILVGHSMAGVVITTVAERRPELVARLVYVAAYLPQNGESLLDWALTDGDSTFAQEGALEYTEMGALATVRADLVETAFCADCTAAQRALVRERVRPEPTSALGTPVTRGDTWARVPRHYVRTSADRAVSTTLQNRMLQATPTPTLTVASGHLPALEVPVELVDALLATP
ncbi:MAG: alpha/beta fold hydrolase [Sandaracinus sp.]|nr:alpha/beta fold hydrolase [Sandaracinus sp.]MCB9611195.1 alpha/beta fold hydrolase [Sandaracinus sp.]MCB9621053.1 alpha/beta fold hydrolase [Sandaracinus sp.]MCB9623718.1 alpha/beta fold hydrolase [Sandaracinus sp.]MCB9630879.1 alpha/beta fold hydrolase [Sandaracinus sp.]